MAFEFPSSPLVGDEFAAGGATYTWTGDTWDLGSAAVSTDYVLKAGDTMTGVLQVDPLNGAVGGNVQLSGQTSGNITGFVSFHKEDGGRAGYVGAAAGTRLRLTVDTPFIGWDLNGGLNFGSVAVTDQNDCRRHLKLWNNTADDAKGFGLNISSGRMNYAVNSTTNMHCFMCGDTQAYMIDTTGASGNMISGTSFIDRSLLDDPTLADFVEGRDVRRDAGGKGMARRGVNLGKLLTHALKEIRELRAEVEQLKGARPRPVGRR